MKQLIRKSLPFYLYPTSNYLLKVNNRIRCEICSKVTLKTPELHQWRRSGVFIVNFEHISNFAKNVSIDNFEQVNVG